MTDTVKKMWLLIAAMFAVASTFADTLITTCKGLAAISDNLSGSYALGADIDLGGADWTPIGTSSEPFTGALHGNGHAIRNLVCTNNPSGNSCRGLFGCVSNATINCVTVSGTVAGKQYVGGLVGRVVNGTVIRECSAAVEVTATGSYAGGLIGSCDGGNATNMIVGCRADGFVGGNGYVGGFIGYVYAPAMISNCVARGDVRSSGSGYGGFVGRFAHASATIDGCWCSGAVWGTGGDIGSFVGNWQSGMIANCAASAYANGLRLFCGNDTSITGDRLSLTEVHARSAGWPSAPKRSKSAALTPIASIDDLLAITNNLAGSYVLTADIDLNGEYWTPIGNYGAAFTGEFYGQGHRILGFRLVTAERYAGFFGRIAGGRVSGVAVEGAVTGSYGTQSATDVGVGVFVGKANAGLVTNSYYDTSANGSMEAAGKNSGGSTAYAGITPIGLGEKYSAASYPSFDFTNTWSIAEGVDEPRLVPLTSFTGFLDGCHLPLNTKPGADVNGIPAGARYVFGINPATGPTDFAKPLLDIGFDSDGKPYVKLPALANTDGATVTVLATEDLADWSGAKLVKMVRDDADGTWHTADDSHLPQMFFKWCVDIPRAEE